MGKRAFSGTDGEAAFRKRQKNADDVPVCEDVSSSDQLRKLLVFDQDLRKARYGLQSFKKLLDDAMADAARRQAKLSILQQYLDAVRPRDTGENAVFLQDIMDMWSFAAQVNEDGVMSSVAVVLALLLRVVSDSSHMLSHGLGVCQTLLQERQLKSMSRNLSSEKAKAFIISPTLRLLREAVCLNGGAYARRVFREKDHTFAFLSRNLEVGYSGEGREDARKSSVRTNAVRFCLSCLKHLHPEGRKELLSQRELFSRLTFTIRTDPPFLILELLDTLTSCVLTDSKIPRDVKFRIFNTKSLTRFLALYNLPGSATDVEEREIVSERAHEFLKYICTTPSAGVLYPYRGLYPKELGEDSSEHVSSRPGQGDETFAQYPNFEKGVPVFNFVLGEFAEKLRPWANLKHSELLIAMFTAAPELIANYFLKKETLTFEPKLSMKWIGCAAFLLSTINVPLPSSFGDPVRYADSPPPTLILLKHILPSALNQKVFVRCLSMKSHLISLFATRLLVAALEKLAMALRMHDTNPARPGNSKWSAAARRLVDAFCQRVPNMSEVVRSYRSIPTDHSLHKALASRLLQLYYQVIPLVALAANFDVSPPLADLLRLLRQNEFEPGVRSLSMTELRSLASIASHSPGMKWFSKFENLGHDAPLSAFTALLHLLYPNDGDTLYQQLQSILVDVAIDNQLVPGQESFRALLCAIQCTVEESSTEEMRHVWGFLNNCIARCAASPIKYLNMQTTRAKHHVEASSSTPLLSFTFFEQLPYAAEPADEKKMAALARFLSLYFSACGMLRQDDRLLETLHQNLDQTLLRCRAKLTPLGDAVDVKALGAAASTMGRDKVTSRSDECDQPTVGGPDLRHLLEVPLLKEGDPATLTRWIPKSVEDLVEDGWIVRLARLLLSEHTNIRKEALTSILKVAFRLRDSAHPDRTQIWLLLSELAESSKAQIELGPVPSAFVAFAMHGLEVLRNPLHPLNAKTNSFLTRVPVWPLDKLPLAHDILYGEPCEDDKYYAQLAWLMDYLLDGLRTPSDLQVLHNKKWFEKLFVLASNPYLRSGLRTRMLKIIYRVACIEAGCTTLVTRFGLLGWLDAQRLTCASKDDAAACEALMAFVWEGCDQDRVSAWSNGGLEELVARALAEAGASAAFASTEPSKAPRETVRPV